MKNILITGATSFIGANLVHEFLKYGYKVYAITRKNSLNKSRIISHPNLFNIECNLDEMHNLKNLVNVPVDVFFHLAWDGTRNPERSDQLIQEKNYQFTIEIFRQAIELKVKKFIGIGSQAEYGFTEGIISEECHTNPTTAYGKAKLKSLQTLLRMSNEHNGIKFIWGRVFSVYGNQDYEKTLVMSAIHNMKRNKEMTLSSGQQNWNYLYVNDLGHMLFLLAVNECECGIYNLASLDNRKLKDYILEIRDCINSKNKLNFSEFISGKPEIVSFQPSINKFMTNFPQMKFISFREGIMNIYNKSKEL